MKLYTLLQTKDINYVRNGALNLGTSEFDSFVPEEKSYIKNIQKKEGDYKNITREFPVWDKIDLKGPNMAIKSLVELFKNKYNVDKEYIIYNNSINLASPREINKRKN